LENGRRALPNNDDVRFLQDGSQCDTLGARYDSRLDQIRAAIAIARRSRVTTFVECASIPFRRFLGGVREFMQRLSAALHGTLDSYLRDALQKGSADAVACLPVPRAVWPVGVFWSYYTPPQKSGQDFAPSQVENVIIRRFY
jgi:hypothetical protein